MRGQGRKALWALGLGLALLAITTSGAMAAPAWLPAQSLGVPQTQGTGCFPFGCPPGIGGVQVAVDGSGGVTLLWSRRTTSNNFVLQTTSRPAGGSFSAPVDIGPVGSPFLGILDNPSLAVDAQGNGIAVWPDPGGSVRAAVRPAGGAFGAPVELSSGTNNFDPRLAMSANGTAVVSWIDDTTVRAASRAPGGTFSTGQALGSTGDNSLATPQVAVNDSGAAAVVWSADPGTGNEEIRARVRGAGGDFLASAMQTLSVVGTPASFPDVEIDATGRATAIWTFGDPTATDAIVQSKATPPGSITFGAVDTLSETGADASFPQVALDAHNNAVAVWVRNQVVESATRTSGGSFTTPVLVSGPGANASIPRVAMDASGNGVAVWTQTVGSDRVVQASRRPQGGTFGSVDPISSTGTAAFPNAVFDNEGNIIAAWSQERADATQVAQVAVFDAAAPTLAAVSVPSAGTAGQGVGMAAAATDRWSGTSLSWSFGDGAGAAGGAVTHAFGSAGAFNVTVTATDGVGNATSATRPIAITPAPPP